jgi:hypothetical protein
VECRIRRQRQIDWMWHSCLKHKRLGEHKGIAWGDVLQVGYASWRQFVRGTIARSITLLLCSHQPSDDLRAQPALADTRGNIRSYTSHGRFGIRNVTYRLDRSRESRKASAAIRLIRRRLWRCDDREIQRYTCYVHNNYRQDSLRECVANAAPINLKPTCPPKLRPRFELGLSP